MAVKLMPSIATGVIGLMGILIGVRARAVVAKARPKDLQHILPGLGQVLASLALFLPWGRGTRAPAVTPVRSERRAGRRQPRG
ncbi:hypothetical protein ACGFY7_50055 [Streptomyces prunicolor]|uniref:hypothetical protein n=1 Tax=Streptomyces prunicolor TaxID=67348 RepID=UPI00371E54DE